MYLIKIITCLFLFIHFSNVCLCEGDSLEELKIKLTTSIMEYNKLSSEFYHYKDLLEEAINRPERHSDIEGYLDDKKLDKFLEVGHHYYKIRKTEASIKKLEPNFAPTVIKELDDYYP